MRIILLLLICMVSLSFTPSEKFYYFCYSKSFPRSSTSVGKEVILYTDIRVWREAGDQIRGRTKEWTELVSNQCENAADCTSDLNYYRTKKDARVQYEKMLNWYADTSRYVLKRVTFK